MKINSVFGILLFGLLGSCAEDRGFLVDPSDDAENPTTPRYLYASAGTCYGGGVTTSTASQLITKIDTVTLKPTILVDYSAINISDQPVSLVDYSSIVLLVLVENAAGRRIDLVDKTTGANSTWLSNVSGFTAQLRNMRMMSDGSVLFSKTTAIEKFSSAKARIVNGASPFINNPGNNAGIANCTASNTLASAVWPLSNGKVLFAHANASNNRLAVIAANGYSATTDCLGVSTAAASAQPTAIAYHATSGHYLVSFGSTTASSNYVYQYSVNESTNAITASASAAFSNSSIVNGPSAMTVDSSTGDVYIANGTSTMNTIEKFTYDSTSKALTRVGSSPLVSNSIYTRCVSDMVVGE